MTDPTPFLSTLIATSAALVAIVGGLLVARFVGLDSDQQGARKVLEEAEERLAAAQQRAQGAHKKVLRWDAYDFLTDNRVLEAIKDGTRDLAELRTIADCDMSDEDISPFLAEIADEFNHAREYLTDRVPAYDDMVETIGAWKEFSRTLRDRPDTVWPVVWERVFEDIALERTRERAKERRERGTTASSPSRRSSPGSFYLPPGGLGPRPQTDYVAIHARQYDELRTARERAFQQVEDLASELRRLRRAHAEVVRPDVRLRWGVGILIYFAAVGIGLPLWVMSKGPKDLTPHIRWLFWAFASALTALLAYMVIYMARLTRKQQLPPDTAGGHEPHAGAS